jgi:tripartite-type tricarboxylate transporter receptor subunit TctC
MVVAFATATPAFAQYYSGRPIDVLIPGAAGGGPAEIARTYLDRMSAHLGRTKFVIRTMPGGGGVRALNYLKEVANPDGHTLLWGPLQLTGAVLGRSGARYKPESFEPIGAAATTYAVIVRSATPPGLRQAADVMKTQNIVVGGIGVGRTLDVFSRMSLDMLGLKYRYVVGYTSQPKLSLALQSNEIDMLTTGYTGYTSLYRDALIRGGGAILLFYHSWINQSTGAPERVGVYPKGTRPFLDFVRNVARREPARPLAEAYRWYATYETWPYWFVGPSGMPKQALGELRNAYHAVMQDEEFKSSWRKRFHDEPRFVTHDKAMPLLQNFRTISPAAADILRKM